MPKETSPAHKNGEWRKKTAEELSKIATDKAENLFNLKVRHAAGKLERSSDINLTRRDLARVKTLLTEAQNAPAKK